MKGLDTYLCSQTGRVLVFESHGQHPGWSGGFVGCESGIR